MPKNCFRIRVKFDILYVLTYTQKMQRETCELYNQNVTQSNQKFIKFEVKQKMSHITSKCETEIHLVVRQKTYIASQSLKIDNFASTKKKTNHES